MQPIYKWKQYWSQSVELVKNNINNLLYEKAAKLGGFNINATDIVSISDDSFLKVFTVSFSESMLKITTNIENNQIGSINQLISHIDRDFSSLVFKVFLDKSYLLHYIPKSPLLIAFTDFPVLRQKDQKVDGILLNNNKQLNWM